MTLSKSRYCEALQCPKIPWLNEHKKEARDDQSSHQAIFDQGNKVGDIAMGYFGDFKEVPYNEDKAVMTAETQRLLDDKTETICEASFSHNGDFCSVDILRVFENHVEIVEVKSSTEVKDINYHDTAFQYYILTSCGLTVRKVSLMHINNKYERQGKLDLQQLFTLHDITEKVLSMQNDIAANIANIKKTAQEEQEPAIGIGEHCSKPYEGPYHAYCWKHIPANSVFDISGNSPTKKKRVALFQQGIVTFEQVLNSGVKLGKAAKLQVETEVRNLPPTINKKAVRSFLKELTWPLYFLDFEGFQEAIPPYNGMKPYMQTAFQYSLHIQKEKGGKPEHIEFLAKEGSDPRRGLAESLCINIPKDACVIVYNKVYEQGRIKEMAERLNTSAEEARAATPRGMSTVVISGRYEKGKVKDIHGIFADVADHLMCIHGNIKDLMSIFQSKAYYSRELGGSWSIKEVLPALCPNDPELDYKSLDLIHQGTQAADAYASLPNKTPEEQEQIKTALLAYCHLDTLAMVKILEKLQQMVNEK
jgi:hypothetical protein